MCKSYYPPTSDDLAYTFKVDVSDADWQVELLPDMRAPVVRGVGDTRDFSIMVWGFTRPWSHHPIPYARIDKAWEASLWTEAMDAGRRCLMPAIGFVQWRQADRPDDEQVMGEQRLALADGRPFAFAGLWEARGDDLHATMLISSPNSLLDATHDKQAMPVVLDGQEAWDRWCSPETPRDDLQTFWNIPFPPGKLTATGG